MSAHGVPTQRLPESAHRRNELYCQIDPSPVAATFVFFLALFMIIQPSVCHRNTVQLVVAHHTRYVPSVLREDAIEIIISRDGTLYLGDTRVICDDVPDMIRDAVRNGSEKRIYLEVDARARYGDVNALLPQIRRSGIENVSLIADSPRPVVSRATLPTL